MNDPTLPLSGLSSVCDKSVVALFDGGMLSSNGAVLALAEVEKRLRVADRLARCNIAAGTWSTPAEFERTGRYRYIYEWVSDPAAAERP